MGVAEILQQIDREIAQLQQARALLKGSAGEVLRVSRNGIPKKRKKKRTLSPEGRKRIIEAVRRRWAREKKAAGK